MPLVEQQSRGVRLFAKYFSLCAVSKTPREGFESITVQNPQTNEDVVKHIKKYDRVVGCITKIEWRDTEDRFEQQFLSWEIHLTDDEGMQVTLSLDFDSAPSSRFMNLAENIDFDKMVEFSVWRDVSGKAPKAACAVKQNGQNVPQKYTKDSPGERPEMVKELGKWNSRSQMIWLHDRMMNVVIPAVEAANAKRSFTSPDEPEPQSDDEWEDDDAPF